MSSASQMLDELMGRNRNVDPTRKSDELHWEDSEVCKHFLCGLCPHELFTNTRADLGPCDKLHDESLKLKYEKSPRYEQAGLEEDLVRFLQTLVSDVERRIRRGQARLSLNVSQINPSQTPQAARDEKVGVLTEKINELVEQAEQLGCEGKVEEAQGVMKLCDQLKDERSELENTKPLVLPSQKEMEVCDICGAFQIKGDAPSRMEDHLSGRQHRGYAKCREYIEEHKAKVRNKAETERERLGREREERETQRQKEREERDKERDDRRRKEVDREKDRGRRDRDRRRSRSRSPRDKRRNRDHHRRHRSRSRDRHERRRSRSRSKSHRSSHHSEGSRSSRTRDERSSSKHPSRENSAEKSHNHTDEHKGQGEES
ncbi:hypothetical protein CAPTEDRAFT_219978 [Capitella teleta]|uniref:Luc7-like protein 3 n=1 Tax=Capitella teleta TaxID=283909 RepID=R7T6G3_CAPTE|nr:hypothetical protein CAPTEDRAFT_219978 [Capitella teleta]|eukprot:ELT88918.1 hypothetical protein CAPTEDRAFT_219978 [Capitella teleta]